MQDESTGKASGTNAAIASTDTATLATHIEAGDAFVLDVRKHARGAQIYGAIRYDPKKLHDAERLILPLPKVDGFVVLYDEDGTSEALHALAEKVRANGYGVVSVLAGGYDAWTASRGRTEEPTLEQPVPTVSGHQLGR